MDELTLRKLIDDVRAGRVDSDAALAALKSLPFRSLADATIDTHRALRTGLAEVVFGEGKTVPQLIAACTTIVEANGAVLATRLDAEKGAALLARFPKGAWDEASRTFRIARTRAAKTRGWVAVVTGGTSDKPVAEEAAVCAEFFGNEVRRFPDVGVAGLHRLAAKRDEIEQASVVIAVAGMEGALASVLAGMISKPVIAVPTSVGYGAAFGGLAALLSMMTSCAAGVGVVNIDNGFGAAVLATSINRA